MDAKTLRPFLFLTIFLLGQNLVFADGALESAAPKLTLSFHDDHHDYAGVWNTFRPGPGNANPTHDDYHWTLDFDSKGYKEIKSMTMIHNVSGEAWSTSSEYLYNKGLYPLVVILDGRQLNDDYDQSLGYYRLGHYRFEIYGQKESEPFAGSTLLVTFGDGTMMKASVSRDDDSQLPSPTCAEDVPFNLGRAWDVTEGIWHGTWARRGGTDYFDAHWTSPAGVVDDELRFESIDGYRVKIYRKGTHGYYHGVLSCDKRSIVDGVGDWFVPGDRWQATIIR